MYGEVIEEEFPIDEDDEVQSMRFINENEVRIQVLRAGLTYFMDVNLEDMAPAWDQCVRYEDRSIFRFPGKFRDYEEGLRAYL